MDLKFPFFIKKSIFAGVFEKCTYLKVKVLCKPSQKRNKKASIAQLVEQLICNQLVGGSSPSTGSVSCSG